ncbi:hypothetical protein EJ08DRAFT_593140 [Tothia fuscella]|uniref:Arrestin-like N-terminal domain-containing protein n=1 Tax=Tothia fuscella TaxID=1048955 RepID=A0A9P4NM76_9PEZI|nr:hypothetical protein EJ08DRAFT_593140 [Tothia fuscella]
MQVRLILDQPHNHFTNLDVITGSVALQVPVTTSVSHINVKLEGEARTRLMSPPGPDPRRDRPRPVVEIHKLLYRVQKVFPPDDPSAGPGPTYLISPGNYTYPFQFKLPFNNSCNNQNTVATNVSFAGFQLEVAKNPTHHVKATLPPSIYYPGEAEIRYYVKCTVNRPSILKENPRAFCNLAFVPIEPPRAPTDGEVYARRQHQFIHDVHPPALPERKGSAFSDIMKRKSSTPSSPATANLPPARWSIDARLPNPAILTCGQDIPLKLIIKQLSERAEPLFLETLQIELVGHTPVRAHEVVRTENNSWVITSLSNLNQSIGTPSDPVGTETELSKEFWYGHNLPDTVAPSFVTCNIARSYELVVSVGLSYGAPKAGMHNQRIVLQLRTNVEVYSGITPPADLLKRMEAQAQNPAFDHPPMQAQPASMAPPGYSGPLQPGAQAPPHNVSGMEDAPPSYEDAVATDLPPLAGARPAYRPPTAPEGESTIDEKRRH